MIYLFLSFLFLLYLILAHAKIINKVQKIKKTIRHIPIALRVISPSSLKEKDRAKEICIIATIIKKAHKIHFKAVGLVF